MVSYKIERESNFELLRIISMFLIILYHLIRFFIEGQHPNENFWSAIQLPIHVGVIVFVLISGYFGINTKSKGVAHLLVLTFIYFTPLALLQCCYNIYARATFDLTSLNDILDSLLCVSKGPYWFVRTYLWLYLLAPAINLFINQSSKHLGYILVTTGIISLYTGLIGGIDPALKDGNNIINFIFLYCLGRFLYRNQGWNRISSAMLIIAYLLFNAILFVSYYYAKGSYAGDLIYSIFFPYDSIGLILNSLLLFMIFGKIHIKSKTINVIAASTFAMYLFHHQPIILYKFIMPISHTLDTLVGDNVLKLLSLILFTIIIIFITVIVDRLLAPLTKRIEAKVATVIDYLSHNSYLKNGFGK